ncbi:hypothetical protein CDL12_27645 [Handroanthus impetiginosus]|uniref:Uncharacterized protein n=1 Tax=Handroanthus impetiginosus TaxID=429701 RepID=A0A2G9G3G3_9LAMI|nr:hypothetical protein CDL12_27645 [Handroanthus impetiginosus]
MASRFSSHLVCQFLCHSRPIPHHHFSTASTAAILTPKSHPLVSWFFNSHQFSSFKNHQQNPVSLHFLSTPPIRPTRPHKTDISARARQLQTCRLWTYALTFSCIAGFIIIVLNQFQDQLVFYITPTDSGRWMTLVRGLKKLTKQGAHGRSPKVHSNPTKSKFRLGGLLLANSVAQIPSSPEIQFVIADLITDILVKYEGSLPDLFREGHSVVVEGFVKPFDEEVRKKEEAILRNISKLAVSEKARSLECYFAATEVLAKHDEKHMPAEVATAIEKNKKLLEEEEKKRDEALVVTSASGNAGAVKV